MASTDTEIRKPSHQPASPTRLYRQVRQLRWTIVVLVLALTSTIGWGWSEYRGQIGRVQVLTQENERLLTALANSRQPVTTPTQPASSLTAEPTSSTVQPTPTTLPVTTTIPATTTTSTTTTTTTVPAPVLASVGGAKKPVQPVKVYMSLKAALPPDEDGQVSYAVCNGEANLSVFIPAGVQVLTVDLLAAQPYQLSTKNAQYGAVTTGLTYPCPGVLVREGGAQEVTDAGTLLGLHEDQMRTAEANRLLSQLAQGSVCVSEAEVNLATAARELLKQAFLTANPDIQADDVVVTVNQPKLVDLKGIALQPRGGSVTFTYLPRCERVGG